LAAQQDDVPHAMSLYEQAIKLAEALYRKVPVSPQTSADLGDALRGVGLLYMKRGKHSSAQEAYKKSVTLAEDMFHRFPENPQRARELVNALIGAAQATAVSGSADRSQQYLARCYEPLQVLQRADALTHPYLKQLWHELENQRENEPHL
jgi:tetratricopeptide (TPR) repeat protein